jgi:hypothetical protein
VDRDDIIATFRKENGQIIKENEIQMIIERYERKAHRDGRITYSEFFSEMRPRFIN